MEHFFINLFSSPALDVVKSVISTAAVIAVITPNRFDNSLLNFLRQTVDLLALNFGNAKNAKN